MQAPSCSCLRETMIQVREILGYELKGRLERGGATTRVEELLREKMDSADRLVRRKSLSERLGLKGISCCGATWGFRPNNVSVGDDADGDDDEGTREPQIEVIDVGQTAPENGSTLACFAQIPAASGMNLAAALAAERHFRAAQDLNSRADSSPSLVRPDSQGVNQAPAVTSPGTPFRMSLMRLLEETDGCDGETGKEKKEGEGSDSTCCVCLGRKKGAAFIPCGHAFCRVCSRELWLNRGFCPLCNCSIIEILDIF